MRTAVFLFISFVLLVGSLSAQTSETKLEDGISVCPFQIGERGRTANFRFSFSYILEVSEGGEITKINELESTKKNSATKFVRDDLFLECMKKWRLGPAGKYFVRFNVGTTSLGTSKDMPSNYMMVVYPLPHYLHHHPLIVELPLSESDKLVEKTN